MLLLLLLTHCFVFIPSFRKLKFTTNQLGLFEANTYLIQKSGRNAVKYHIPPRKQIGGKYLFIHGIDKKERQNRLGTQQNITKS